jgi:acetyl esterase/lipase
MSGSKSAYEPIIRQFADAGYAAAAVEYRFAPTHKWPAQVEDVKCAVRYLRAHAKELNIDPNRIGAVGDSAGGHLALLLGLMDPKDGLEGNGGNPAVSSKVQAVVNIYGPVDLRTWHVLPEAEAFAVQTFGKSSEALLADFVGTPDRTAPLMAQASPVTYVNAGDPPILTFHGTKDPIVPFEQAKVLQAALEKAGVAQKLVPLEGGGHGLDLLQIATVSQQALVFFDSCLNGAPAPTASNPKEETQTTR